MRWLSRRFLCRRHSLQIPIGNGALAPERRVIERGKPSLKQAVFLEHFLEHCPTHADLWQILLSLDEEEHC